MQGGHCRAFKDPFQLKTILKDLLHPKPDLGCASNNPVSQQDRFSPHSPPLSRQLLVKSSSFPAPLQLCGAHHGCGHQTLRQCLGMLLGMVWRSKIFLPAKVTLNWMDTATLQWGSASVGTLEKHHSQNACSHSPGCMCCSAFPGKRQ